jgi:aryl-alcohol dehydrogenase-like predicted oxidoreductase
MAMKLVTRAIGAQGLRMPAVSLGTMGLSWGYSPPGPAEAAATAEALFDAAMASGCNAVVTAHIYASPGAPHNEELVGRALARHGRANMTVVTKIGA